MTYQRADILDDRQDLKRPFGLSLVVHTAVIGSLVAVGLFAPKPQQWGGEEAGGGAVGISVENAIPLPQTPTKPNPLADNTESEIAPDKEKVKDQADKEALEKLLAEDMSKLKTEKPRNDVTSPLPKDPNQLSSSTGAKLNSPLLGKVGTGGIGVGSSAMGDQFGAYLQAVQQRISSKWRSGDVNPRLRSAPPVLVSFVILRNGDVRDVRVLQTGGDSTYDLSAQRAVVEAGPFEPLPTAYKGSSALIEVAFKLER
jgi:periplasmic protein TonB